MVEYKIYDFWNHKIQYICPYIMLQHFPEIVYTFKNHCYTLSDIIVFRAFAQRVPMLGSTENMVGDSERYGNSSDTVSVQP